MVHELAHAADHEFKQLAFGTFWRQPIATFIPDPKERYLWEISHFIWDEHYASRISVPLDREKEPFEDELFATSYTAFKHRIREARCEYHWHRLGLEEFLDLLRHNLRMVFLSAGYLFGLADGLGEELSKVAPRSSPLLKEDMGQAIMRFHEVLLALWKRDSQWESYDEFLDINRLTENLLNILDLYLRSTDDGEVYIDIPAWDEHVHID